MQFCQTFCDTPSFMFLRINWLPKDIITRIDIDYEGTFATATKLKIIRTGMVKQN